MIISKTPFRVSFFGGGTDYPDWYKSNGGSVISMAINKYCYITCRYLPPFFDYKYRIRYFKREEANNINDIEHPVVREALKFMQITEGVDLVHHADLPAQSGLGSSSTFTVSLLHSLSALKKINSDKYQLAKDAIFIEQNLIKENVGSQDQVIASYGGFNRIDFGGPNEFNVTPIKIKETSIITKSMLLFFTGLMRSANDIAKEQVKNIPMNGHLLGEMLNQVNVGNKILEGQNIDIKLFGELLDEQWKLKKSLASNVSNQIIDHIYEIGMKNGAYGGKVLGAGGGGFILFIADPSNHNKITQALANLINVPIEIDFNGSSIIYSSGSESF
jgi:D-glycero-alpha-D-manno-heptose-7-phosphate kinase